MPEQMQQVPLLRLQNLKIPTPKYIGHYFHLPFFSKTKEGGIDWMGFLSTDQLQKELGKCRGLLNTPKWNEAYGNVVVEALACGVPVVAYKRGGPSEIIQHGQTGYLAEPDDKKNMLFYVETIEKIKRQKCREWVEKNASVEIFANKVLNWLNKVIIEYK